MGFSEICQVHFERLGLVQACGKLVVAEKDGEIPEKVLHIVEIFDKISMLTVRPCTFPVLVCRYANGYSAITVKLAGTLSSCIHVSMSSLSLLCMDFSMCIG